LKFTDVVLSRTHAAITLARRIQVFAGADLLTKQPSTSDEPTWQGGLIGTRVLINNAFSAWVRGEGGPMLGDRGWWLTGDAAAQYRVAMVESFFFESALGSAYTRLLPDAPGVPDLWFVEVLADVGLALREKDGKAALWLSFDFRFPVTARPDRDSPDLTSGAFIDPQTRVNVRMGGRAAVNETVDLFVQWSIFDRGDLFDPATTLPVLNRGFDQQQLVFGFILRFGNAR
jgi:hypothetical protein